MKWVCSTVFAFLIFHPALVHCNDDFPAFKSSTPGAETDKKWRTKLKIGMSLSIVQIYKLSESKSKSYKSTHDVINGKHNNKLS